jgi:folate-binding Fe-S cluster repair protein YgfZ
MDNYGSNITIILANDIKKVLINTHITFNNKVLIKCNGEDTRNFLNTQFTNDIKN